MIDEVTIIISSLGLLVTVLGIKLYPQTQKTHGADGNLQYAF
jgi:hypothetical protein